MTEINKTDCVVMVTGGSGFLGQHVIKLLNTHAKHVTSIKVVDLEPFKNKLGSSKSVPIWAKKNYTGCLALSDYSPTKPVHHYIGSITDENLMREAMRGCHCVIHLAGVGDYSMFPNRAKLERVNVQGTLTTLRAAQEEASVSRFIGCGAIGVIMSGSANVIDGDENTPIPETWLYKDYTATKYASDQLILDANCSEFSTAVLLLPMMYGELDHAYVPINLKLAQKCGGQFYRVNTSGHIHQQAVCAEKKLYEEQTNGVLEHLASSQTKGSTSTLFLTNVRNKVEVEPLDCEDEHPSGTSSLDYNHEESPDSNTIAGRVYFATDDTPNQNVYDFMGIFVKSCGYKIASTKLPYHLIYFILYSIYTLLYILSFIGIKRNVEFSIPTLRYTNCTVTVIYEKAKKLLGYSPLFTPAESFERSACYYKELVEKKKTA